MNKTYTYTQLVDWCKRAFADGYSAGLSDGHPLARVPGAEKAYDLSGVAWDLQEENIND